MEKCKDIVSLYHKLKSYRFSNLEDEKSLQVDIFEVLQDIVEGDVEREYRLSKKDIVDFFWKDTGVAIEVKIKGSAMAIYRQLERYAQHSQVKTILFITSKTMGMPQTINDKPLVCISLGESWL